MSDQTPKARATNTLGKIRGILLWLFAFAFGRWAGIAFVIPVCIAAAAFFLLKKLFPLKPKATTQALAVQLGHLGWMSIALFIPKGLEQVIGDIILLGGALLWFGLRQSRASAYCLIGFQTIAGAVNLAALLAAVGGRDLPPLCVHLLFRVTAIVLMIVFLRQKKASQTAQ